MVFVADDFGAWLVALLADAARRSLTTATLGSRQERALRSAATVAIRRTADELRPDDSDKAEELAMVVSEVFGASVPDTPMRGPATLLEALQAGIAEKLVPLSDPNLTGTGKSSLELLGISPVLLTQKLTGHLVREIVIRGAQGGALAPLAAQLNNDMTHLRGQRIEEILGRLDNEVRNALARLETPHSMATAPVALAQLPGATAGFTGRDSELAVLTGLLDPAGAAGPVIISAVAGLAGVGKTTLAVEAGHAVRQRGWFPGGVLFIDLHGYDDQPVEPSQALDALLRALRVRAEDIPPGVEERAALYRSVFAAVTDPMLVILDNASSEAQVQPLLPGAGPHRVVVTSRHTLAGLEARLVDVTELDDAASVKLLDTALRTARPGDDRVSSNRETAIRLAQMCGGLPLALQIVAALLKADPALSANDLADELAEGRSRLDRLRYDNEAGGSALSVEAAFELSYRRLRQGTAQMFRLLPLNPGPDFSTDLAVVLADQGFFKVRRSLVNLASAHMIEAAPGAVGRWRMHDLVRLYAQRLSDTHADYDRRDQARNQLLSYYLKTTQDAVAHLLMFLDIPEPSRFTGRDDALSWLDAERSNLVATVGMTARLKKHEVAFEMSSVLVEYLSWRRDVDQWLTIAEIGLGAARSIHDRRREAGALNNLGIALQAVRRFEEAVTAHRNATAISRTIGDRHLQGGSLHNLGKALEAQRLFDEAITAYEQDLAICQEVGDRRGEGTTLNSLAICLREADQVDEAIEASERAVVIFQEIGDRPGEGMALNNLAAGLASKGQLDDAITVGKKGSALLREVGDPYNEAMALVTLGSALYSAKRHEEAIVASQNAMTIFRHIGDRHGEGMALSNMAGNLLKEQRTDEAIAADQNALSLFRETHNLYLQGKTLGNLGIALQEAERLDEAMAAYREAIVIFRDIGDRSSEGKTLGSLGSALGEAGQVSDAITVCEEAATVLHQTGDRREEGWALYNLGTALRDTQRFGEATDTWLAAATIFRELGDRHDEGLALSRLVPLLSETRKLEQAIAVGENAVAIFEETADLHEQGQALYNLGVARQRFGQVEQAITAWRAAAAKYAEAGDQRGEDLAVRALETAQAAQKHEGA